MLDTGLSVVEVIVAVITLFSGGYAGGRAAAIARMRTDDRRRIRDKDLGALLHEDPARSLGRAREYFNSWEDVGKSVALLPWADRAGWRRLTDQLESQPEWRSIAETMPSVGRDKDWYDSPGVEENVKDTIRENFRQLDLVCVSAEAHRLWQYLGLTLRPTPLRRLRIWKRRWELAKGRPRLWPWKV